MPKSKIFIADDEQETLLMLKNLLSNKGFEVMVSSESAQLVKLIKNFRPQIILLDLSMPGMDGFGACELLNEDPEIQGIPVIIISGFSDLADIKKAYRLGVVGYITKPFEIETVVTEIEKAIANRKKPQ